MISKTCQVACNHAPNQADDNTTKTDREERDDAKNDLMQKIKIRLAVFREMIAGGQDRTKADLVRK